MRIIAGQSKGRKIKIPEGIRPTQDRVRESIFNVLANKVLDSTILDLFAGSGSFGLEALSRGADEVTFIETKPSVINVLIENIDMLGYKEKTRVIRADAIKTLQNLESSSQHPDIVFADPPYNEGFVDRILEIVEHRNSLSFLVLEHSKEEKIDLGRTLRFGETQVNIIKFTT